MVATGDAREVDYSALASVGGLQRLHAERLYQPSNIGDMICGKCNHEMNSNDLRDRDPLRSTTLHALDDASFEAGGPFTNMPPDVRLGAGGFTGHEAARDAGVGRTTLHYRAARAAAGHEQRPRKGAAAVPSRAAEAAAKGLAPGSWHYRRKAEREGRPIQATIRKYCAPRSPAQLATLRRLNAERAERYSQPVKGRRKGQRAWVTYRSRRAAAAQLGVRSGNIAHCLSGKQTHTGGYEFRAV